MIIDFDRDKLAAMLAQAAKACGKGAKIHPLTKSILIRVHEQRLVIEASDLVSYLSLAMPIEKGTDGAVCLPGKKIAEVVACLPAESVHLQTDENHKATIKSGRAEFEMVGLSADDFPKSPDTNEADGIDIDAKSLLDALAKVSPAMWKGDASRFNLMGVYFEPIHKGTKEKGSSLRLVATDGHRLSLLDVPDIAGFTMLAGRQGVILPAESVKLVMSACAKTTSDDSASLMISEKTISLEIARADGVKTVLSCRCLDGDYPDYHAVIPKKKREPAVIDREALGAAVGRIGAMGTDRFDGIRLAFKQNLLTISAENPALGSASDCLDIDYPEEAEAGISADYLAGVCAVMLSGDVLIQPGNADGDPFVITGEGDPEFKHVIMPMRL